MAGGFVADDVRRHLTRAGEARLNDHARQETHLRVDRAERRQRVALEGVGPVALFARRFDLVLDLRAEPLPRLDDLLNPVGLNPHPSPRVGEDGPARVLAARRTRSAAEAPERNEPSATAEHLDRQDEAARHQKPPYAHLGH
jgi:hypothetical protein